jgi:hypothetical protein
MKKLVAIWAILVVLALVGEVKCIVKAVNCNWDPIGKAEILYTAGAVSGLGTFIGWMDIKDE